MTFSFWREDGFLAACLAATAAFGLPAQLRFLVGP